VWSLKKKPFATLLMAAMLAWTLPARAEDKAAEDPRNILIACATFYQQLKDAGFIKDENMTGAVPVFIVDENQWRRTEFKNKAKLGGVIRCLVGSLPGWSESEFRSNLTNKLLGKLHDGRLELSE
jgi:hypothetical protein